MESATDRRSDASIRPSVRPGDLGAVAALHGRLYEREYGFGPLFEAYVAEAMAGLVQALDRDPRAGRLWVVEAGGRVGGSIAIARVDAARAQLRWFLLAPRLRGRGLGRRLLGEALDYAKHEGYRSVFLWTVDPLARAAQLYRAAGFELAEERPGAPWDAGINEQRYELRLA